MPLMTQGRVRIPESNADPWLECPGVSSARQIEEVSKSKKTKN
jgi:hypothetical protein